MSASSHFCPLLITYANSLGPDQDRQNVGSDLDPESNSSKNGPCPLVAMFFKDLYHLKILVEVHSRSICAK